MALNKLLGLGRPMMSIMQHTSRQVVLGTVRRGLVGNSDEKNIEKEIKDLIADKIRPTIQEDGGDLEFVSYANKIVRVKLQGACTSCPSSTITLKSGIKNILQYYIPEVEDVEQVFDD